MTCWSSPSATWQVNTSKQRCNRWSWRSWDYRSERSQRLCGPLLRRRILSSRISTPQTRRVRLSHPRQGSSHASRRPCRCWQWRREVCTHWKPHCELRAGCTSHRCLNPSDSSTLTHCTDALRPAPEYTPSTRRYPYLPSVDGTRRRCKPPFAAPPLQCVSPRRSPIQDWFAPQPTQAPHSITNGTRAYTGCAHGEHGTSPPRRRSRGNISASSHLRCWRLRPPCTWRRKGEKSQRGAA